jgi:hypothetical protein
MLVADCQMPPVFASSRAVLDGRVLADLDVFAVCDYFGPLNAASKGRRAAPSP